jgi:heme exporter protein D
MHWNSWQDFWYMGGYALYVWSSFGVTAGLMGLECVQAWRAWVKARTELLQTLDASALQSLSKGDAP